MKQEIQELDDILIDYRDKVRSNDPDCSNHWVRRFYRCWVDGSYLGEDHYKKNLNYIEKWRNSIPKLRQFAISNFIQFLHTEFPEISDSTIRRHVVSTFTKEELDNLNKELIEDSLDLIE